jgi:beta-galactosidase GanA
MQNHSTNAVSLTPRLPAFYFGGDYNPEQWTPAFGYEDETIWHEDLHLMRLASVNVATVGVFSWVALQPDEHSFTQGVEVTRREGNGRSYNFVLNHNRFPVHVSLPVSMYNLLTRETHEGSILLSPAEVAVLVPSLSS